MDLEKFMFRYKVVMDQQASVHGGTVMYLNQHTVLWGVQKRDRHNLGADAGGVCAGLALEWIKATLDGQDFIKQLDAARNAVMTTPKETPLDTAATKLFKGIHGAHEALTAENEIADNVKKLLSKKAKYVKTLHSPHPHSGLESKLTDGSYYFLVTQQHVAACVCRGDKVDLYDPNVGVVTGAAKKIVPDYFEDCMVATRDEARQQHESVPELAQGAMDLIEFTPIFATETVGEQYNI